MRAGEDTPAVNGRSWFERDRCKGGTYCVRCRTDRSFRERVVATHDDPRDVDYACPYGVPWSGEGEPQLTGVNAIRRYQLKVRFSTSGAPACFCGSTAFTRERCDTKGPCGGKKWKHTCSACGSVGYTVAGLE